MKTINDKKVDLHIHSYYSDGTWDPEEVVRAALNNDVGIMSITDHDDLRGILEGEISAKNLNIKYLRGIEISSTLNDELFHILAYGMDISNKELLALIEENTKKLEEKDDNTIKYLIDEGYHIDFEEYLNYENNPRRGGWKALNFLIDKKLCEDVGDYFGRLFKDKHAMQFPVFKHPSEVIEIVKKAGGVSVLAHPYYYPSNEEVSTRLGKFLEYGIEGFECIHPNHSEKVTRECIEWCKKNKLIITAGSDSHGDFIKSRIIGKPEAKISDINLGILEQYIV